MNPIQNSINEVSSAFGRLTPREKRLVSIGSVAIVMFVLYFVQHSFDKSAESHKASIDAETRRIVKAQALSETYRESEAKRLAAEQQLKSNNVRLISYIEEKATAAGLTIPTLYPKSEMPLGESAILENTLDITLTDIKIDRLVKFLSSLESGPGIIQVSSLRIEPRVEKETLTAWITVASYRMKP